MPDLRDLYQELILDHSRRPRNFREMPDPDRKAEGYNPLCGDQLTVYVRMNDSLIEDISFVGSGCAISKASASMMTATVKGKTREEAESLFGKFHHMITVDPKSADPADLGKLAAFAGVAEFPVRVKCATLPWHTLKAALAGETQTVSTELTEGPIAESGGA